jgi:hypothetical protein
MNEFMRNSKEISDEPDSDEYLISKSFSKKITETDITSFLANFSTDEEREEMLTLARNEIYARLGGTFETTAIQNYFNEKPWYQKIKNQ